MYTLSIGKPTGVPPAAAGVSGGDRSAAVDCDDGDDAGGVELQGCIYTPSMSKANAAAAAGVSGGDGSGAGDRDDGDDEDDTLSVGYIYTLSMSKLTDNVDVGKVGADDDDDAVQLYEHKTHQFN